MRKGRGLTIFCLILGLCLLPHTSHAGLSDLLSGAKAWWSSKSIGNGDKGGQGTRDRGQGIGDRGVGGERTTHDAQRTADSQQSRTPGMCQVPREPQRIVCEAGSDFLCVSTPAGGVAEDSFYLQGTIDRKNSVVASVRVSAQNEYTKKLYIIDTANPAEENCWTEPSKPRPFCLDADGRFSARVSLPEKGPYTVSVSASRFSGESQEKHVRISRVVPLRFDSKKLLFDPNVLAAGEIDSQFVTVSADLLGDCKFCDFIGASTGAVIFSITNTMKTETGVTRSIECKTQVEQGGQGKYVMGIPVGRGTNTLKVKVCNGTKTPCPGVDGITFTGKVESVDLTTLSPQPRPIYDSSEFPVINWQFQLGTLKKCVKVSFNRESTRELCSSESGVFSAELRPKVGINIANVYYEGSPQEFVWTFGWGKIRSPFANDRGEVGVQGAAALDIPVRTINTLIVPFVNNYINSDDFAAKLMGMAGGDSASASSSAPGISIPGCDKKEKSFVDDYNIRLRGRPKYDLIEVGTFSLGDGEAAFSITLKNLNMGLNLVEKTNDDPTVLPLTISFRRATLNIKLISRTGPNGKPVLLLASRQDDCSFRDKDSCTHQPAALTPSNFTGGLSSGDFAECDTDIATGGAWWLCNAINAADFFADSLKDGLLDGINSVIYCSGSAALSGFMQNGFGKSDIRISPSLTMPLGVSIGNKFNISENGILAPLDIQAGSRDAYAKTPAMFKVPTAGVIAGREEAGIGGESRAYGGELGAGVSFDALNALLYVLIAQGDGRESRGLLDLDIDERFFKNLNFDAVKSCDAKDDNKEGGEKNPPTLCFLRPRISEMMGASLVNYGYFNSAAWPLMIAVRGSRALAPYISLASVDELPVVKRTEVSSTSPAQETIADVPTGSLIAIELGGVTLSFYALEIDRSIPADEYGNVAALYENGKPKILSMRPYEADPLNGPIVSADLSLLMGAEIGEISKDETDESNFFIPVRILSNRTKLVISPIADSNATTIPAGTLLSSLTGKVLTGLDGMSTPDKAIRVPVPRELVMKFKRTDSLFEATGIEEIKIGIDGISFDRDTNSINLLIQAALTQLIHVNGGEEVEKKIP